MVTPERRREVPVGDARVTAAWIEPTASTATLVVAHGAGAGMDHPFMVGFGRAMADARIATVRFNFPYTERGRRSPDPERVLRATWLAVFDAATAPAGGPVLAGGKSLGGRIASMCVADGMPAAGLVFLGYPLHPPGKPDRLRDEHLDAIRVPMLFLQGTRDPFATSEPLETVVRRLGGRATLVRVDGGDHSFRVRGAKADDGAIGAALAASAAPFVRRVAGVDEAG